MFRSTCISCKISPVSVPAVLGSLSYTPNYKRKGPGTDYELAKRFKTVDDTNRYEALRIIFWEKLASSYVGRRQYKLNTPEGPTKEKDKRFLESEAVHGSVDKVKLALRRSLSSPEENATSAAITTPGEAGRSAATIAERERLLNPFSLIVPRLIKEGIDWHDLKSLNRIDLLDLMKYLELKASERVIFLSAVESKMCGVLTKSGRDRRPGTLCVKPGKECFGWRCGENGHVDNLYFEGKPPALPLSAGERRRHGFLSLNRHERQLYLAGVSKGTPSDVGLLPLVEALAAQGADGGEASKTATLGPSSVASVLTRDDALFADSLDEMQDPLNPFTISRGQRSSRFGSTKGNASGDFSTASASTGATSGKPESSTLGVVEAEFGLQLEVRTMPDFSVVGRLEERIQPNPRIWSSPGNPIFEVQVMGFEFRVHPEDPRALSQIEAAAGLWEMHASVIKAVVWEMLELYAVERPTQPLHIEPFELGAPDDVNTFSSAFISHRREESPIDRDGGAETTARDTIDSSIISEEDVTIVERRIYEDDAEGDADQGSIGAAGARRKYAPWFRTPLPQAFTNGVPDLLPFAPTIIIQATFKPMVESVGFSTPLAGGGAHDPKKLAQLEEHYLHYPLLDVSILVHPDSCFWWSQEDEEKALEHVLAYAKKVPYAIPFNLYIRVDKCRELYGPAADVLSKEERLEIDKRVRYQEVGAAEVRDTFTTSQEGRRGSRNSASEAADEEDATTFKEVLSGALQTASRNTIFNVSSFRTIARRQLILHSLGDEEGKPSTSKSKFSASGAPEPPRAHSHSLHSHGEHHGRDAANSAASILHDIDVSVEDMMFPDVGPDDWE